MANRLGQVEPVRSRYSRSLEVTTIMVITITTLSKRSCHSKLTSQTPKPNRIKDHSAPPDSKYRPQSPTACKALVEAATDRTPCTQALTLLHLQRMGAIHHVFQMVAAWASITRIIHLTCRTSIRQRFKRMTVETAELRTHDETLASNRLVRITLTFWSRIRLQQGLRVVDIKIQAATK